MGSFFFPRSTPACHNFSLFPDSFATPCFCILSVEPVCREWEDLGGMGACLCMTWEISVGPPPKLLTEAGARVESGVAPAVGLNELSQLVMSLSSSE